MKEIINHAEELAIWGTVMVSMIIAVVGMVKPFVFPNHKALRKTTLSLMNIGASFASTAIYLGYNGYDWKWYFAGSFLMVVATIVTYHIYENYHLREAIHKVGSFAIDKCACLLKAILAKFVKGDNVNVKAEVKSTFTQVATLAKSELKKASKKVAKHDKDLENL
jgi:hypothetical protein